jgi:hypothetical protein
MKTRDYAADADFLGGLRLDPSRRINGWQCSGALLLAKLGLLEGVPVCTDLTTKPWVIEAGGCLSSQYLAAWMLARLADLHTARMPLHYVAPVGEKDEYVDRALANLSAFLPAPVA